jgi:serine/threonine protein kinase
LIQSKPPEGTWWVKLCDLGLSRRSADASGTTSILGTKEFIAPEVRGGLFQGNPKTANAYSADMWSLGEVVARIFTGGLQALFNHESLLRWQKGEISFPIDRLRESGLSTASIDFIQVLTKASPTSRLTASQALQHHWLEPGTRSGGGKVQPGVGPAISDNFAFEEGVTQASGKWTDTISFHAKDNPIMTDGVLIQGNFHDLAVGPDHTSLLGTGPSTHSATTVDNTIHKDPSNELVQPQSRTRKERRAEKKRAERRIAAEKKAEETKREWGKMEEKKSERERDKMEERKVEFVGQFQEKTRKQEEEEKREKTTRECDTMEERKADFVRRFQERTRKQEEEERASK